MTAVCASIAIVLIMTFGGLTIAAAVLGGRSARMNAAYREVAKQLKGRFRHGGWLRFPVVHLRYGDVSGTLTVVKVRGIRCTQLTVDALGESTEWEACTQPSQTSYGARPWDDVPLQDPRLASVWRWKAAEPLKAQALLTDGVLWQLERMANFKPTFGLVVQRNKHRFQVRCEDVLGDWRGLAEFVRSGFELHEQLGLVHGSEIEFVDGVEATLLEAVVCPVCGDPIETQLVYCAACKTPHHQECWDYNSRCSTFACGERTYCLPKVALPLTRAADAAGEPRQRGRIDQFGGGNGK